MTPNSNQDWLRLFIAINFPEKVKQEIAVLVTRLKRQEPDVRWEKKEKFHLTLAFLGWVKQEKLAAIEQAIKKAVFTVKPFKLSFNGFGFFLRNGRLVIWLGIVRSRQLEKLKLSLDSQLRYLGFTIPKRVFSPHVTLGRKKQVKKVEKWRNFFDSMNRQGNKVSSFTVRAVVLVKSKLTRGGSIYKVLKSIPLKS